jgi:hypothetical protein
MPLVEKTLFADESHSERVKAPGILEAVEFDEAKNRIREKIISGQWWVFVPCLMAARWLEQIEQKYYWGEANTDFECCILWRVFCLHEEEACAVIMLKKSRMSVDQFCAELHDPDAFKDRDPDKNLCILFDTLEQCKHVAACFNAWLWGDDALMTDIADPNTGDNSNVRR